MLGQLMSPSSVQCLRQALGQCVKATRSLWGGAADVVVINGAKAVAKAPPDKGYVALRAFKAAERQFWQLIARTQPAGKTTAEFIKACNKLPGRNWTTHVVNLPILREFPALQARRFPWSRHRTTILVPGVLTEVPAYANYGIGHELVHALQMKHAASRPLSGWGMGPVKNAFSRLYKAVTDSRMAGTPIRDLVPLIQQEVKRLSPKQADALRKAFLTERQAYTLQAKSAAHFGVSNELQAFADQPMVAAMKEASRWVSKAVKGRL